MRRILLAAVLFAACETAAPAPTSAPTPTFVSPGTWFGPTTPIRPAPSSGVFGEIALRPAIDDGFVLHIVLWERRDGAPAAPSTHYRWTLAQGTCAEWGAPPPGDTPAPRRRALWPGERREDFFEAQLPVGAVADHTAWLLLDGDRVVGCADLPIAAAEARRPLPAPVRRAAIRPAQWLDVSGEASVAATPSGDRLLSVTARGAELSRRGGEPNALWHLVEGSCEQTRRVLFRGTFPLQAPDRQMFTLMLPRTERPAALAAFVNGGGPLLACADLDLP